MKQSKEDKINAVCKEVLKDIKPTPKDTAKMVKNANEIIKVIDDGLGKDVKCVIGGSVGKNTNLR